MKMLYFKLIAITADDNYVILKGLMCGDVFNFTIVND